MYTYINIVSNYSVPYGFSNEMNLSKKVKVEHLLLDY